LQRKLNAFASHYSTRGKVWTAMLSHLCSFILIEQQLSLKLIEKPLTSHGPLKSTGLI